MSSVKLSLVKAINEFLLWGHLQYMRTCQHRQLIMVGNFGMERQRKKGHKVRKQVSAN